MIMNLLLIEVFCLEEGSLKDTNVRLIPMQIRTFQVTMA
jgi:hypothetical protein